MNYPQLNIFFTFDKSEIKYKQTYNKIAKQTGQTGSQYLL